MSLIGIDVGTSAVKVAAYGGDGTLLAMARQDVATSRPCSGCWESEPEAVWAAARSALRDVAATPTLAREPARALAISASGREVFPAAGDGAALGPCILTGDLRGEEIEAETSARAAPTSWYRACGHLPERMDPVLRLLWWRRHRPGVFAKARSFLGWHEFLTLRLCGRAVTDRSLAGKWLSYDLATGAWSTDRLAEFDIPPTLLPSIQTAGTPIATILPAMADELGLPRTLLVGTGAFDTSCAALGAGAGRDGTVGLACGTWESMVMPATTVADSALSATGSSIGPHPGETPFAIFALNPNGSVVTGWSTALLHVGFEELEAELQRRASGPSQVVAVPHLSGATNPRLGGRDSRGAVLGLTLACDAVDIVQAVMEGIAFDLTLTLDELRAAGARVDRLRATGGGTRSAWWMQLKADLTGVPVEVVHQPEPGTLGAAMLAGVAVGAYESMERAFAQTPQRVTRYQPNRQRAHRYDERLGDYGDLVASGAGPLTSRRGERLRSV